VNESLISQQQWDSGYVNQPFLVAPVDDPIRSRLEKFFAGTTGSCLELGCFPGRYLAVFGEFGYEVHGIDLTPRVTNDLPDWLRRQGYRVGEFVKGDALHYPFGRAYDVVCSFGFIEHFTNWAAVVRRHGELVKPGGHVVISTPNFRGGFQQVTHAWLDRPNFEEHNIEAMIPAEWTKVLESSGFETLDAGYIGGFDFWVGPFEKRNLLKRALIKAIRKSVPIFKKLLPDNNGYYAPYCMLVGRKT
jgi:SAM-dependent methyltransferase